MAGTYAAFYVQYETTAGVITSVGAGISVAVREEGAGSDVAESPLTTDANGQIASGSIAALSAGDIVHFRVQNFNGMAASITQTLT